MLTKQVHIVNKKVMTKNFSVSHLVTYWTSVSEEGVGVSTMYRTYMLEGTSPPDMYATERQSSYMFREFSSRLVGLGFR